MTLVKANPTRKHSTVINIEQASIFVPLDNNAWLITIRNRQFTITGSEGKKITEMVERQTSSMQIG